MACAAASYLKTKGDWQQETEAFSLGSSLSNM